MLVIGSNYGKNDERDGMHSRALAKQYNEKFSQKYKVNCCKVLSAGFSDFPVGHAEAEPWSLGENVARFWQEGEGNVTFWMDNFGDTQGNFSNNLEFEMIDGALVAKSQILEESQNQFCLATGYIAGLNGGDFNNGWLKTQGVPFMRLVRTGENSIKFIPETYTLDGTTYTFQQFGVTKRDGSQVKGTPVSLPFVAGPSPDSGN